MLYNLVKIPARLALWIYGRRIDVNDKAAFNLDGPLLLACNHPNSFLDAIILATLFKKPVYSLTRGDSFKKKFYASMLGSLNMLPVYRMSEGVENLEQNYETFDRCKAVFKQNGIVLIFSEGRCVNEWKLRPLKKGTARLAISSWQDEIGLDILPVGINYQSFRSFGKNIQLNFGKIIQKADIPLTNGYGNAINDFNLKLNLELKNLVVEIDSKDKHTIREKFEVPQPLIKRIILFLPALVGYIIHAPLFLVIQKFNKRNVMDTDHHDSVTVGLLFLSYPFYLSILAVITYLCFGWYWWILIFVLMPFCARSFVQLKRQF